MRSLRIIITMSLLFTAALSGCTTSESNQDVDAVVGGAGTGGGSVNDLAPQVIAFEASTLTADNSGTSAIVFSGQLRDLNSELDLEGTLLSVGLTGAQVAEFTRTITNLEAAGNDAEPATYTDGWKVWSGDALDGDLFFKFRYVIPVGTDPSSIGFTPSVDPVGTGPGREPVVGDTSTVVIETFSELVISGPVLADGTSDAGNRWGRWAADPGATNVESLNWIVVTNTGQDSSASVVIDFTENNFTGVDNPNFTIPVTNNVQFAWWEDTTPDAGSAPNEGAGSYTVVPANADGTVTVTFSGLSNIIYVGYTVLELPSPLPAQLYGVAYTATEL